MISKIEFSSSYSDIQTSLSENMSPVLYIWKDRLLYIGKLPKLSHHQFTLDLLVTNLEQPYKVSIDHGCSWQQVRTVLWPANIAHDSSNGSNGSNVVAIILCEHNSIDSYLLKKNMTKHKDNYFINLNNESSAIKIYTEIFNHKPDLDTTYKLLNYIICQKEDCLLNINNTDRRINKVLASIKNNPSRMLSIKELSQSVNLSESRLQHLFKDVTNINIVKYRNWYKIIEVVKGLSIEKNMTQSAIDAGFTDIAHFSRSFKTITGATPTSLFTQNGKTNYFIDSF